MVSLALSTMSCTSSVLSEVVSLLLNSIRFSELLLHAWSGAQSWSSLICEEPPIHGAKSDHSAVWEEGWCLRTELLWGIRIVLEVLSLSQSLEGAEETSKKK